MSRKEERRRSCVACRYYYLKCSPDCPLAAYFPAARSQESQEVFKMHHPKHIQETLRLLDNKHDRDAAVSTMILQARHRRQEAQLQDIKRRRHIPDDYVPGSGPITVPGSGRKSHKTKHNRRVAEPIRDATGSGQETETRNGFGLLNRPGSSKDATTTTTEFGSGSGRQMGPGRRVFGLGQPIGNATGSGQEIETLSGSGSSSSRTGREDGLGERTMADLYRFVSPIVIPWVRQEMEARSGSGSRNEEVTTTEFWTPEDGDMTWIEDTIKYFFEGEE